MGNIKLVYLTFFLSLTISFYTAHSRIVMDFEELGHGPNYHGVKDAENGGSFVSRSVPMASIRESVLPVVGGGSVGEENVGYGYGSGRGGGYRYGLGEDGGPGYRFGPQNDNAPGSGSSTANKYDPWGSDVPGYRSGGGYGYESGSGNRGYGGGSGNGYGSGQGDALGYGIRGGGGYGQGFEGGYPGYGPGGGGKPGRNFPGFGHGGRGGFGDDDDGGDDSNAPCDLFCHSPLRYLPPFLVLCDVFCRKRVASLQESGVVNGGIHKPYEFEMLEKSDVSRSGIPIHEVMGDIGGSRYEYGPGQGSAPGHGSGGGGGYGQGFGSGSVGTYPGHGPGDESGLGINFPGFGPGGRGRGGFGDGGGDNNLPCDLFCHSPLRYLPPFVVLCDQFCRKDGAILSGSGGLYEGIHKPHRFEMPRKLDVFRSGIPINEVMGDPLHG